MIDGHWFSVLDGDPRTVDLYVRHYSSANRPRNRAMLRMRGISGPGESLILLTVPCDALFVWRWERHRKDGQEGINCAVFRNEGPVLSSVLIEEACALAWVRWPGVRLFTFVNPRMIRSSNPGACFLFAGWRRLERRTLGGLVILERLPGALEAVA